jgi:GIY-YIG catalytic domain
MPEAFVYWLHLKDHTDFLNQGYIGVSKNPKERIRHHFKNALNGHHSDKSISKAIKKYGKNNICVKLLFCSSEDYCYEFEKMVRPNCFIGWNTREGGYHTPNVNPKGNKLSKIQIEKTQKTIKEKRLISSVGRDKKIKINDQVFNSIKSARESFGISKTQMTRYLQGFQLKSKSGNTKFDHLRIEYAN